MLPSSALSAPPDPSLQTVSSTMQPVNNPSWLTLKADRPFTSTIQRTRDWFYSGPYTLCKPSQSQLQTMRASRHLAVSERVTAAKLVWLLCTIIACANPRQAGRCTAALDLPHTSRRDHDPPPNRARLKLAHVSACCMRAASAMSMHFCTYSIDSSQWFPTKALTLPPAPHQDLASSG